MFNHNPTVVPTNPTTVPVSEPADLMARLNELLKPSLKNLSDTDLLDVMFEYMATILHVKVDFGRRIDFAKFLIEKEHQLTNLLDADDVTGVSF